MDGIHDYIGSEVLQIGNHSYIQIADCQSVRCHIRCSCIEENLILFDTVNLERRKRGIIVVAIYRTAGVGRLLYAEHIAKIGLLYHTRERKLTVAYTSSVGSTHLPAGYRRSNRVEGIIAKLLQCVSITFRAEVGNERIVGAKLIAHHVVERVG